MNAAPPDQETIRAALALAIRAPSVHNSQPWRWRVAEQTVQLYADPERQLAHADPDRRDMLVSCGVALQHFTVALAALGWHSHVQRFPNPADPEHLATVQIGSRGTSEQDIALAAAIPRRRTDRRWYSAWPVAPGDLALMAARAARAGVALRRVPGPLTALMADAVREHAADAEYLTELSIWSGRYDSLAGVPAHNAPAPDVDAAIPARAFANPVLPQPRGAEARDDAGVVVVLATATDDAVAQLRGGEAAGVVLLTATALGLSTCAVTEPLEIESIRKTVRATVLADEGYPQMLVRVGWAPVNADPLPATPRRPLEDVVEQLNGAMPAGPGAAAIAG
ncbi:MAG: nitroreductase family protein [Mycobacteriaceae bacterium]|nr:nitroreductase family protein [Mycobacteriaceae bacterium]MBV9641434.1 nitroreductase family protein [Mycobacteriaceae bacterium]